MPISQLPKLGQINSTIQDPLARFNAVMALPDLFTVEPRSSALSGLTDPYSLETYKYLINLYY